MIAPSLPYRWCDRNSHDFPNRPSGLIRNLTPNPDLKVNEDPKDTKLREYQEEIQRLKEMLKNGKTFSPKGDAARVQELTLEIEGLKTTIADMKDSHKIELGTMKANRNDVVSKLKSTHAEAVGLLETENTQLKAQLNVVPAEVAVPTVDMASMEAALDALRSELEDTHASEVASLKSEHSDEVELLKMTIMSMGQEAANAPPPPPDRTAELETARAEAEGLRAEMERMRAELAVAYETELSERLSVAAQTHEAALAETTQVSFRAPIIKLFHSFEASSGR